MKNICAGKQKAWLAAFGAFVSALIMQMATGQPVDLSAQTGELAALAADAASSLVVGGITFALAYFKTNVAADGTEMQFVKPGPTPEAAAIVVNAQGDPKGKL